MDLADYGGYYKHGVLWDTVADCVAAEKLVTAERERILREGFCRKCGETYAPHGGSDPEHRWPY